MLENEAVPGHGPPHAPEEAKPGWIKQRCQRPLAEVMALVALTTVACVERIPLLRVGYWGDEATCLGIATHPLGQIPRYLRLDAAPPLYYVVLHWWVIAFGESPVATHVLSLMFALMCIPVGWWMGRVCFGRWAGLGAAALAASLPYFVYYSSETRMYSLLGLTATFSVGCFVRVMQGAGTRWLVGAIVASVATVYTHDWGLFLIGVEVVVGLAFSLHQRDRRLFRRIMVFGAVTVASYLPWLPTFWFQLHHTGAPWAVVPSVVDLLTAPEMGAGLNHWLVVGLGVAAAVLPLRVLGERRSGSSNLLGLLALVCGGTVLAGWCAAQFVRCWDDRYLGVAVAPLMLVLAARLARSIGGRLVLLVLVACLFLGALPTEHGGQVLDEKSDAATVLPPFRHALEPGDVVMSDDQGITPLLNYYLHIRGLRYAGPLSVVANPSVYDGTDPVQHLKQADPELVLNRMVASLAPGGHVLLVSHPGVAASLEAATGLDRLAASVQERTELAVAHNPNLHLVDERGDIPGVATDVPMVVSLYTKS
jgi:mannosyltransferase